MLEFGSDFHLVDGGNSHHGSLMEKYQGATYLADGRQCIITLIQLYGWKRIWMPEYFCYNIIEYLQKSTPIEVIFYTDYPGNNDEQIASNLEFQDSDVFFRMNFFGLRAYRSEKHIPVPVIEDHSHDLSGDWAINSSADWCIASLRKIIPIPEGGVLWSPKGHTLDLQPELTSFNDSLAQKRWHAMELKSKYLKGEIKDKESFRQLYIETEEAFDEPGISSLDMRSMEFLESFDLNSWNLAKKNNWKVLKGLAFNDGIKVLFPERGDLTPFSFILLCRDQAMRDRVRSKLIDSSVFPAVLWNVPDTVHQNVKNFSSKMLSIHCDARYGENDIEELYNTINTIIRND